MRGIVNLLAIGGVLGTAACAVQPPQAPTIAAMPSSGKPYEQFQAEDARCRQAAAQSVGAPGSSDAAERKAVGATVAGTALGAAAGALIGSTAGHVGTGAAIGAGAGLLVGAASGANSAGASSYQLQRSYDITYAQCMAAAGNAVPQPVAPQTYAPAPYPYPYPYAYPAPAYYYEQPVGLSLGFGWGGYRHRYW